MTEREARKSAEYKQIVRALGYESNKAHRKKAQALIDLEWRDPEADYDVGDTPSESEAAA